MLGMLFVLFDWVDVLIVCLYGIILVIGLIGFGKSMMFYVVFSCFDVWECNIMIIEDLVEYELEGIGQIQVNVKVEMIFVCGLCVILCQDLDVVLVGEICDGEIVQIVVQVLLIGYLVLLILYINSVLGVIFCLQDMGVEFFLFFILLLVVMLQWLVC